MLNLKPVSQPRLAPTQRRLREFRVRHVRGGAHRNMPRYRDDPNQEYNGTSLPVGNYASLSARGLEAAASGRFCVPVMWASWAGQEKAKEILLGIITIMSWRFTLARRNGNSGVHWSSNTSTASFMGESWEVAATKRRSSDRGDLRWKRELSTSSQSTKISDGGFSCGIGRCLSVWGACFRPDARLADIDVADRLQNIDTRTIARQAWQSHTRNAYGR